MSTYVPLRHTRPSSCIKIIMTLRAYLDDSGKQHDPVGSVAVVGGMIATVEEWDKLEPEWFAIVCNYGIKEFKAADFEHSRNDFEGWSKEKKDKLHSQLTETIKRNVHAPCKPIGALLPKIKFQCLTAEEQAACGNDSYFLCLQDSIQLAAIHALELYREPENIVIHCDEQPESKTIAERVYYGCKEHFPAKWAERLSGFGMYDSRKTPGLQVADLVAYECNRLQSDILAGNNVIDKLRATANWLMKYQWDFEHYTLINLKDKKPLIHYGR